MNPATSEPYLLRVAALTDPGRARGNNEDYLGHSVPPDPKMREQYGALLVVCDGVGGHVSGEVASQHAVQRILSDYYQAPAADPAPARLVAAIQRANQEIFKQNAGQRDEAGMGTTVVAAVVLGRQLIIAHAGDSRAYLIRAGQAKQLTQDHSYVAELLRRGDISPEQAENHPWRNRITRYVGHSDKIEVESHVFEVSPGDIIVLCSDGLTRHVNDGEIAAAVANGTVEDAVTQLVDLANRRGGKDNISVIAASLTAPAATPLPQEPAGGHAGGIRIPRFPLPVVAGAAALLVLALVAIAIIPGIRMLTGDRAGSRTATPTAKVVKAPTAGAALVTAGSFSAVIKSATGAYLSEAPWSGLNSGSRLLVQGTAITLMAWQIQPGTGCQSAIWLSVQLANSTERGWICADAVQTQGSDQVNEAMLKSLGLALQVAQRPTSLASAAAPTAAPTAIAAGTPTARAAATAPIPATATAVVTPLAGAKYRLPRLEPIVSQNIGRVKVVATWQAASVGVDLAEIAFAPDGLTLVTGSFDKMVRVWRTADGALLLELSGHSDAVSTVAYSPDGRVLASGSHDKTVRIWGADGKPLQTLKQPAAEVESIAFSPDGKLLAATIWDGSVLIWDTSSWALRWKLVNEEANRAGLPISSRHPAGIAFLGQGTSVAAGTDNGSVAVWSLSTGVLISRGGGHTRSVWNLSAAPSGDRLGSASADGTSRLWDFKAGVLVPGATLDQAPKTGAAAQDQVMAIAFSRNGSILASAVWGGRITFWDPGSGATLGAVTANANLASLSFSPDGSLIAVGAKAGAAYLWGIEPAAAVTR